MTGSPDGAPDQRQPPQPSAVPFVVAVVLVAVIGGLGFVFLRSDDAGELVRPDQLDLVDDDVVRATASGLLACWRVERAQVDFDDDGVFIELVARDECEQDPAAEPEVVDVVAEIELPEPVGDRRLVAGVGRTHLPCEGNRDGATTSLRCAAAP